MNTFDDFTVVVPSYTGQETIAATLNSILNQNGLVRSLVVVIDGPNKTLRSIVDSNLDALSKSGIDVVVHQFKTNKGRFYARLKGAELASTKYVLFMDDRIDVENDYVSRVISSKKHVLIPSVIERDAKNIVSYVIRLLRKRIYKGEESTDFTSYAITKDNFESSPKGSTSFWVDRKLFIKVCRGIEETEADLRNTNEDTKMFKGIIDAGNSIWRSSKATIYYSPRASAWAELVHMYKRGPRFVNYYIRPGTRFFIPLVFVMLLTLSTIGLLFIVPSHVAYTGLLVLFVCLLVASIYVGRTLKGFLYTLVVLPLLCVFSLCGILKGLLVLVMPND